MVHSTFSLTIMLESKFALVTNFREEDCNVDVRDVISGEEIAYHKFINKYVVKVEPHRAILEPDYFIKWIEMAE
jgi:hypothetical protein